MLSTLEVVQRLHACTCLSDVSALREELFEDLQPEHHCLFFARTAHFLGQDKAEEEKENRHNDNGPSNDHSACTYEFIFSFSVLNNVYFNFFFF